MLVGVMQKSSLEIKCYKEESAIGASMCIVP
jgi:hypothetical protein